MGHGARECRERHSNRDQRLGHGTRDQDFGARAGAWAGIIGSRSGTPFPQTPGELRASEALPAVTGPAVRTKSPGRLHGRARRCVTWPVRCVTRPELLAPTARDSLRTAGSTRGSQERGASPSSSPSWPQFRAVTVLEGSGTKTLPQLELPGQEGTCQRLCARARCARARCSLHTWQQRGL